MIHAKRIHVGFMLMLAITLSGTNVGAYTTPGTGVKWTLADVAANAGGDLTGSAGNYALNADLTIAENDTLTLSAGEKLAISALNNSFSIVVEGTLIASGTTGSRVVLESSTQESGSWRGISITGKGYAQLSFTDIRHARVGVYFDVQGVETESFFQNCRFTNGNMGIMTDFFNAPALTIRNSEFLDLTRTAIAMRSTGDARILIAENTISNSGQDAILLQFGGSDITVSGNTIEDNHLYGININTGVWNAMIKDNTISRNQSGGIALNTSALSGGDHAIITGNTITANGPYGIRAIGNNGLIITGNTISGHSSSGIHFQRSWNNMVEDNRLSENEYGVYVSGGIAGRSAETAEHQWIEVNYANADKWSLPQDDAVLAEAPIGFDFPIDTVGFTHFQMQTNGVIELSTAPGQTNNITLAEGRGAHIKNHPEKTFIFAKADDWQSGRFAPPMETHNGTLVRMDGWGYKVFSPGDTDGDGNNVSETCLVLRWYMTMASDNSNTDLWNDFQVVIYPDGRVRWNTRFMNGKTPKWGQYAGIYAGNPPEGPLEIMAGSGMGEGESALYDPETFTDISTQIRYNRITENSAAGIGVDSTISNRFQNNEITTNAVGMMLLMNGSRQNRALLIDANNIHANTGLNFMNDQPTAVMAPNNYWAVLTPNQIDALIRDDDEDSSLGEVNFAPFLTEPAKTTVSGGNGGNGNGGGGQTTGSSGGGGGCFISQL